MDDRLNAEWLAVSAIRDLAALATHHDPGNISYNDAIALAAKILPPLLGEDSLLGKGKAPYLAQEYEERARVINLKGEGTTSAIELVDEEIQKDRGLLQLNKLSGDSESVNRIKARLKKLEEAREHLDPRSHSEHEVIFRDAYNIDRTINSIYRGKSYNDFYLDEDKALRIRVLHPDKPEQIIGADLIYERHDVKKGLASLAAVQYKIWKDKKLYLNDPRMQTQLEKMKSVFCNRKICKAKPRGFRFPCCSAFLRPTDKLQSANQALRSTGEHLPICLIDDVTSVGANGAKILEWKKIRDTSLSGKTFEELFADGRIGSNWMSTDELHRIYSEAIPDAPKDKVIIYAQELTGVASDN